MNVIVLWRPFHSFKLGHLRENHSQWPTTSRANSEHDAFQPLHDGHVQCSDVFIGPYCFFKSLYDYVQIEVSICTAKKISDWKCVKGRRTDEGNI